MSMCGTARLLLLLSFFAVTHAKMTFYFDMDNANSSIYEEIATSVRESVSYYNAHGLFNKHLNIQYNPSVPTADASFSGNIRFGGSRNTRVALHEIMHTIGVGTTDIYSNLMADGTWAGPVGNAKLSEFDGPGSVINGDNAHLWPYGLNFDSEDGAVERYRHVQIAFAVQCDMGFQGGPCEVPTLEGLDRRVSGRDSGLVWGTESAANGDVLELFDHEGIARQRWDIVLIGENVFSFRSRENDALALDVFDGSTAEGAKVGIWEWTGAPHQLFAIDAVPETTGWYVVRPLHSPNMCLTADGSTELSTIILASCESAREEQHWGVHV